MCPPLSCCHGRSTSPLCVPLYYLLRLQLASATQQELLAVEPSQLRARQHALWQAVEAHYCAGPARARELIEQLLTSLLLEDCCRQALRQAVSLVEALGPAWAAPAVG